MSSKNQDRIVSYVLTLASAGGATFITPALWPVTVGAMLLMLLIVKFSNDQLLRVLKYVLIVITTIIVILFLIAAVGLYTLWRLLS
jgi:uncharacterized membrane protein